MSEHPERRKVSIAQLQIHACVVLWGFTAILGKVITLPALPLVWWRMAIVAATLALVPRVRRAIVALPRRRVLQFAGVGLVVGVHWLTFYGSIKLANASVAATCMATAPVFAAVVEPLIMKRSFDPRELAIGVIAVPGVALVVGAVPHGMLAGIAIGVVSAGLAATFQVLNKRIIEHTDALAVTALELGAGMLLMTVVSAVHGGFVLPSAHDGVALVVLAYACTILPFALSVVALRQLSAFAVQLAVNLEPVYAVVIAGFALGERHELSAGFYVGVVILVAAVVGYPLTARGARGKVRPDVDDR